MTERSGVKGDPRPFTDEARALGIDVDDPDTLAWMGSTCPSGGSRLPGSGPCTGSLGSASWCAWPLMPAGSCSNLGDDGAAGAGGRPALRARPGTVDRCGGGVPRPDLAGGQTAPAQAVARCLRGGGAREGPSWRRPGVGDDGAPTTRPWVPGFNVASTAFVSARVRNYQASPFGPLLDQIWIHSGAIVLSFRRWKRCRAGVLIARVPLASSVLGVTIQCSRSRRIRGRRCVIAYAR
jgi:hypothetical protein